MHTEFFTACIFWFPCLCIFRNSKGLSAMFKSSRLYSLVLISASQGPAFDEPFCRRKWRPSPQMRWWPRLLLIRSYHAQYVARIICRICWIIQNMQIWYLCAKIVEENQFWWQNSIPWTSMLNKELTTNVTSQSNSRTLIDFIALIPLPALMFRMTSCHTHHSLLWHLCNVCFPCAHNVISITILYKKAIRHW
jgi:hypothetical protein